MEILSCNKPRGTRQCLEKRREEKRREEKRRDPYIDILKAIGIISIVIGHSSWVLPITGFQIGPFVYSYHLMIFLFVAAYFGSSQYENEKIVGRLERMGEK